MPLQISQRRTVAVILLAVTLLLSANDLRAQSAASASESGVAVLRNGQTMAGEISRQDSKIILRLESGSRIYLAQERVKKVPIIYWYCRNQRSPPEGYRHWILIYKPRKNEPNSDMRKLLSVREKKSKSRKGKWKKLLVKNASQR